MQQVFFSLSTGLRTNYLLLEWTCCTIYEREAFKLNFIPLPSQLSVKAVDKRLEIDSSFSVRWFCTGQLKFAQAPMNRKVMPTEAPSQWVESWWPSELNSGCSQHGSWNVSAFLFAFPLFPSTDTFHTLRLRNIVANNFSRECLTIRYKYNGSYRWKDFSVFLNLLALWQRWK